MCLLAYSEEACKYRLLRRFTAKYEYDIVTESEIQMLIWAIQEGQLAFMKVCTHVRMVAMMPSCQAAHGVAVFGGCG